MARWDRGAECHWWRTKVRWQRFWSICFEIFLDFYIWVGGCAAQLDDTSPDRLKGCLVRQLRFAAELPLHFVQLYQVVFACWTCAFSSLRSRCNLTYIALIPSWGIFKPFKKTGRRVSLRVNVSYLLLVWFSFFFFSFFFFFMHSIWSILSVSRRARAYSLWFPRAIRSPPIVPEKNHRRARSQESKGDT